MNRFIYENLKQYDKKEKILLDELALQLEFWKQNKVLDSRPNGFKGKPKVIWKLYESLGNFYYDNDKYDKYDKIAVRSNTLIFR